MREGEIEGNEVLSQCVYGRWTTGKEKEIQGMIRMTSVQAARFQGHDATQTPPFLDLALITVFIGSSVYVIELRTPPSAPTKYPQPYLRCKLRRSRKNNHNKSRIRKPTVNPSGEEKSTDVRVRKLDPEQKRLEKKVNRGAWRTLARVQSPNPARSR